MGEVNQERKPSAGPQVAFRRALDVRRWVARLRGARRRGPRTVAVWDRTPAGWRVVEGEVGGERPVLRRARLLSLKPGSDAPPDADETILLTRSPRAVVREVELPEAPADEMRRMLALRLESDLPYDLSGAVWAFQRRGAPGPQGKGVATVVVVPTADVAAQEDEMRRLRRSCDVVESREGALAQMAVALGGGRAAALASVEDGSVGLVVADGAGLAYARRLSSGAAEEDLGRLAGEVRQSLQHYAFGRGRPVPARVLLAGDGPGLDRLAGLLADDGALSVEMASPPESLSVSESVVRPDEAARGFAACIGALVSAHCRARDEEPAAPPLRLPRAAWQGPGVRRRIGLVAANALLVVALLAAGFGARRARLQAAERAVRQAQSLQQDIAVLEEEVGILQLERDRHRSCLDVLLALAEALPKGVMVGDLSIDSKGNVTLTGKMPSPETASQAVAALSESDAFAAAQLQRWSTEEGGISFHITCTLRPGGA